jgi:D-alanyl-D-alanine carboxypeptidase
LKLRANLQEVLNVETEEEKMSDVLLTKLLLDIPVPFVSAQSWVVYDSQTEQVLFGRMERERREIASLTKIMTCYVVLTLIKRFNLDERSVFVEIS